MRSASTPLLPLLCASCLGGGLDGDAGAGDGGPQGMVTVTVSAPQSGASLPRNYLTGDGKWVARPTFEAQLSAAVDRADWHVDWSAGGVVQGVGFPPDYRFTALYRNDGDQTLEAIARDASGGERGRAAVSFHVSPPTATSGCKAQLAALGVTYTDGPATPGIVSPVTLSLPINDLVIRDAGGAAQGRLLLDCTLALAVWRAADVLRSQHVTAVSNFGLYVYRCVDGSVDPPGCPGSTLSQHGSATAIDFGAFLAEDGSEYVVDSDWLTDELAGGQDTCSVVPRAGARNRFLHQVLCEMHLNRIFTVLLTPNFGPANHDHFHLDLTPRTDVVVW